MDGFTLGDELALLALILGCVGLAGFVASVAAMYTIHKFGVTIDWMGVQLWAVPFGVFCFGAAAGVVAAAWQWS